VFSKSKIVKFLKRDCGTIPVAEIISGKIEIFSKHQRFLIAYYVQVSQKWRTNYLLLYRGCLNVHEKNMEKMFPTKKSIIFIIKMLHSLGLVYKSMRGVMTDSIDRDQWLNVTSESRDRI
jgi:hypothetical protein